MKIHSFLVAAIFIVLSAVFASAQSFTPTRVATIDVDQFSDSKTGITRLINATKRVDMEMKPRSDEIARLVAGYDTLIKRINEGPVIPTPEIELLIAEAKVLGRDIETKQRNGQTHMDKRVKELNEPIYADIMQDLDAFAKKRSIDIVIDISKIGGSVMIVNNAVDITDAFVAEYNAKPVKP